MFDIGWQELIIVGVLAVIVMGPRELPRALRTVMGLVRKARSMAGEFQQGVDEMIREVDLDDLRKDVASATQLDISGEIKRTIDPGGDIRKGLDKPSTEADLDELDVEGSATAWSAYLPRLPMDDAVASEVPAAVSADKNKTAE